MICFSFFCVALFGGSLGTLSIVKALFLVNFKHLTVVTLLQKLQPIFAILLARILLKEKLKKDYLFWGFLALLGGYFLTFDLIFQKLLKEITFLAASLYSFTCCLFHLVQPQFLEKEFLKAASF